MAKTPTIPSLAIATEPVLSTEKSIWICRLLRCSVWLYIFIAGDCYDIREGKYFFSFPVSSSFYGTQWHEIHPQYWTKFQVWEWLQHLLDTNQLDANCIPFQEFDINGEHLCSMSLQEFTQAAGTAGQLLYSNLQHLKWNGK